MESKLVEIKVWIFNEKIIIRHAFAWHNYIKKGFDYDKKEVYSNFLMDPPLHPIGEK